MSSTEFRPAVLPGANEPELTLRAILLGAIIGIAFGAASTYLALRVGLTVSASVPGAVIAIALLRPRGGKRAILEHNITQTTGSAGESVASAVVFTIPALIFLGHPMQVGWTTLIALSGGVLGVLLMVPLRQYLIVREHGKLRYPEGKACAEILSAGEVGGASARKVFLGMAVGGGFKAFQAILAGVKGSVSKALALPVGTELSCDVEPPLFGVGYIIGYRISVLMVAGSLLSSLVLIPMIIFFGKHAPGVLAPGAIPISEMAPGQVWNSYVRYIGAGSVATGGIFGLLRAMPAIVSSLRASAGAVFGSRERSQQQERTNRDMPLPILIGGSILIVLFIWMMPQFNVSLLGAVLILLLGFLFGVVSSRITGEVGSSSCPLSGMTIAVLMGTCGLFLLTAHGQPVDARQVLTIGAVVCIAISQAGTCSQDLKTGYLVGSTPVRQQIALAVGVATSVLAIGWTASILNLSKAQETAVTPFAVAAPKVEKADTFVGKDGKSYKFVKLLSDELPAGMEAGNYLVDAATDQARWYRQDGVGSAGFPAPQARLMSVVIDGLLTRSLPWDLIALGAAISIFIELLGYGSLTFAVGVYLPLSSTMPVFLGGVVRKFCDKRFKRVPDAEDETEGTLFSSGLIAGASLVGIAAACISFLPDYDIDSGVSPSVALLRNMPFAGSDLFALLVIGALMACLGWGARPRRTA